MRNGASSSCALAIRPDLGRSLLALLALELLHLLRLLAVLALDVDFVVEVLRLALVRLHALRLLWLRRLFFNFFFLGLAGGCRD